MCESASLMRPKIPPKKRLTAHHSYVNGHNGNVLQITPVWMVPRTTAISWSQNNIVLYINLVPHTKKERNIQLIFRKNHNKALSFHDNKMFGTSFYKEIHKPTLVHLFCWFLFLFKYIFKTLSLFLWQHVQFMFPLSYASIRKNAF